MTSLLSLHRLASGLATSAPGAVLRQESIGIRSSSLSSSAWRLAAAAATDCSGDSGGSWRQPQHQLQRRRQLQTAASYSVVSSDGSAGQGRGAQPWRLIIYSKEGCHLCDGLKEKVEALLERAEFMPSALR